MERRLGDPRETHQRPLGVHVALAHLRRHESRLELVPEWESAVPAEPAPVAASASATGAAAPARARIVRIEAAARRSPWRDRAVLAWASVATAAAVLMLVANVRGRLFDSGAATLLVPGAATLLP